MWSSDIELDGDTDTVIEVTPVHPFGSDENINDLTNSGNRGRQQHQASPKQTQITQTDKRSCLVIYFSALYYFGLYPYKNLAQSSFHHKVYFGLVNSIALLVSLDELKTLVIFEPKQSDLLFYVEFVYLFNSFVFRFYFVYLVSVKLKELNQINKTFVEWQLINYTRPEDNNVLSAVIWICIAMSVLVGTLVPFIEGGFEFGFEMKEIVLYNSLQFSKSIYVWDATKLDNMTDIIRDYATTITPTTISFGVADISSSAVCFIQESVIKDVSLFAALCMNILTNKFVEDLKSFDKQNLSDESDFENIWKKYQIIRKFSDELDSFLGQLIQMFHLDNLLLCAYFLFNYVILQSEKHLAVLVIEICYIGKLMIFYWLASKASSMNTTFRSWIRLKFRGTETAFIENSSPVNTSSILDELDTDPVGIGRSLFFIDRQFLWKFASVVGSYFLFFTDSQRGDT